MENIKLTPLTQADYVIVKDIYDWYVLNSTATFHTEPINVDELAGFMYLNDPVFQSFLIKQADEVVGYCYTTRYKNRQAYDRTAEVTLYLKHDLTGRGIGVSALSQLEEIARKNGLRTLLAIITGENKNSIRLFEKCGYEKCAHFKRVGEKFGRILDVVGYQKEL